MGQLLVPAMIGAGVGAVGGAATGANPFKTALLGAGLGAGGAGLMGAGGVAAGAGGAAAGTAGTGAGAGLVGGANLTGAGLAAGTGAGTFAPAIGTVAPSMLGTPTLNASLLTPGVASGLGATPSVYGGLGASSLMDKTGAFLSNNIGNPFSDLTARDKLGLGLQGVGMLNQPQQQMQAPPVIPITRGNPEMVSSPLYNVAPNVGMQEGNELGLPNLLSRMPLTEEELLRLQQQLQTTGFRGR
jgi:hypothetical protein